MPDVDNFDARWLGAYEAIGRFVARALIHAFVRWCYYLAAALWLLWQIVSYGGHPRLDASLMAAGFLVCVLWVHQVGVLRPQARGNEWIFRGAAASLVGVGSCVALAQPGLSVSARLCAVGVWALALLFGACPLYRDLWLGPMISTVALLATVPIALAPWIGAQPAKSGQQAHALELIVLVLTFAVVPRLGIQRYKMSPLAEKANVPAPEDKGALRAFWKPERYRMLETTFWSMWGTLIFSFGAATTGVVALLESGNKLLVVDAVGASYPLGTTRALAVPAIAITLCILSVLLARPKRTMHRAPLGLEPVAVRPSLVSSILALGAAGVWGLTPWLLTFAGGIGAFAWSTPLSIWLIVPTILLAVGVAILIGYVAGTGLIFDVGRIEFQTLDGLAVLICISMAIACGSTNLWLWLCGAWTSRTWLTLGGLTGALAVVGITQLALVTLTAATLEVSRSWRPEKEPRYISLHHPVAGVFQDQLLFIFGGMMLLVLIYDVYALVREGSILLFGYGLIAVSSFVRSFRRPFTFIESDVEEHLRCETIRLPSPALDERARYNEGCAAALNTERVKRIRELFRNRFRIGDLMIPLWSLPRGASGKWRRGSGLGANQDPGRTKNKPPTRGSSGHA